ncbi:PD-(D/E)XK nuclease family protein [Demequina sp. TTPB684]|uniref:RecB family exonuclease n=1 Tax=unclassified Demequina TaxID=2620311 RepID=UPI001CF338F3|nr:MULTISPECIES: PD-(D/E)XK nuclease family protein [unclassified Demequina]MCB2413920.1 PD-(D/E)XK nuclease family protein [Demequina sp. TTPB684]UPU89392.1 PD-(D/E)XK nuclease family protein [Demequina sp. TMPB413]
MSSAPGLSPSRANDYAQCAYLYRLRVIDRIPEAPQRATTLGTLVHLVLERLFDLPASERDAAAARTLLAPAWEDLVAERPELEELLADSAERAQFFDDARARIGTYFVVENPTRLEPHGREVRLESSLENGPSIRGVIDRIDRAPDGALRIIDYKSGKTPRPGYGDQADFQMKFYALLVERVEGTRPALMRLLYLRDGGVKELTPSEADVAAAESRVRSTWNSIQSNAAAGHFPTSPSKLCAWCSFQSLCPEFGGTVPSLDPEAVARATGITPDHKPGTPV